MCTQSVYRQSSVHAPTSVGKECAGAEGEEGVSRDADRSIDSSMQVLGVADSQLEFSTPTPGRYEFRTREQWPMVATEFAAGMVSHSTPMQSDEPEAWSHLRVAHPNPI